MKWHDFFYFSRGERRALVLLLSLIAMAWIAIVCTDMLQLASSTKGSSLPANKPDTIRAIPKEKQTDFSRRTNKIPGKSVAKATKAKRSSYPQTEKYPIGTIVELNTADTITLKKVPGIGSVFARRIIKYRELLGGFHCVEQLSEVYGIDEERYGSLKDWFMTDTTLLRKLPVNQLTAKQLAVHPYISYRQAQTIERLVHKKGNLRGWEDLYLLEEFEEHDRQRLLPYLAFSYDIP